jgi:uridine kinase
MQPEVQAAADVILAEIRARMIKGKVPFLVAIDGGSGAGKSTLGLMIAQELGAALVQSDDFYDARIADAQWDAYSAAQKVADVIDWRRLRTNALEPLLAGKVARWHPFDFERQRADGTYPLSEQFVVRQPADVIVLDGAYSSRPEVADLIDLSVLVDVPVDERHRRLLGREDGDWLAGWHRRWDEAEAYYFGQVRPKESFDLVVRV